METAVERLAENFLIGRHMKVFESSFYRSLSLRLLRWAGTWRYLLHYLLAARPFALLVIGYLRCLRVLDVTLVVILVRTWFHVSTI